MGGLREGMKEIISKRVFNVGAEGSSRLIKHLKELPSWESPFFCGHAKLLPGEVFVLEKNSIYKYEAGRTVCPIHAKSNSGREIRCPGLNDISITKYGRGAYGDCEVVKKRVFIKKNSEPVRAFKE